MSPSSNQPSSAASPTAGRRRGRSGRPLVVLGVVGVVLAAVLVGWWTMRTEAQRVTATTVGYDVLDDTSVEVVFDVTRPVGQPVTCTLSAMDSHFTVVGRADVVIPVARDDGQRTTHHEAIVRTTTRAVTGVVQDCVRT